MKTTGSQGRVLFMALALAVSPCCSSRGSNSGKQDPVERLAQESFSGKWGYINHDGETVIAPQFTEANEFSDGLALVEMGDKGGHQRFGL